MLCIVFSIAAMLSAGEGEYELEYRQLASRRTLSVSWGGILGGSSEVLLTHMHELPDEIGYRYLPEQEKGVSFGRMIYSGAFRMFVNPGQVLTPSKLLSASSWSLRVSELSSGKLACTLEGETASYDWSMFLDAERMAAGWLIGSGNKEWQVSAVCIFTWNGSDHSGNSHIYSRRVPRSTVLIALWGGIQGKRLQAAAAVGKAVSRYRRPGWWFQGSCSWDFPVIQGNVGIFGSSREGNLWSVTGEMNRHRLSCSAELSVTPPGLPVALTGSCDYSLEIIPPWPEGAHLPGEAVLSVGAECKLMSHSLHIIREISLDWRDGFINGDTAVTVNAGFVFPLIRGNLKACFASGAGLPEALEATVSWKWRERSIQIKGEAGGDEAVLKAEVIQPAEWGEIGISLDSAAGLGLFIEASLGGQSR